MKKAKSFALIANYIDCSLMRNTVALWLANYLEMPFANHCIPVKVYFNGICKGQYMLTEKQESAVAASISMKKKECYSK